MLKTKQPISKFWWLVGGLIIISLILTFYPFFSNFKKEALPSYHQELAKQCQTLAKDAQDCCLASVQKMAEGNFKLAPKKGCQLGYHQNALRCPGTYSWCEPPRLAE